MTTSHEGGIDVEPSVYKPGAPDPPTAKSPTEKEPHDAASDVVDSDDNDDENKSGTKSRDMETATEGTAESAGEDKNAENSTPIVSSSKKSRPPYKYDPHKITLRFLFANKDGLTVTIECDPKDTVGEVKTALISVWPEGECSAFVGMLHCCSITDISCDVLLLYVLVLASVCY
jgi:hypothetical protein